MNYANFFTKENIPITFETFNDHSILSLAEEALKEKPNDPYIMRIIEDLTSG